VTCAVLQRVPPRIPVRLFFWGPVPPVDVHRSRPAMPMSCHASQSSPPPPPPPLTSAPCDAQCSMLFIHKKGESPQVGSEVEKHMKQLQLAIVGSSEVAGQP